MLAGGRTLEIEASDVFDLLHLEQRADRVLPNGWCMLPPRQACDRGNVCLSCSMFTTDESHRPEQEQQLGDTERLIRRRQEAFETKNGCPMPEDNMWLEARRSEQTSLRQVLIALDEIKMRPGTAGSMEQVPATEPRRRDGTRTPSSGSPGPIPGG